MRIVLALLALVGLAVIVLLPRNFMDHGTPARVAEGSVDATAPGT
jgi:hypothetical protein